MSKKQTIILVADDDQDDQELLKEAILQEDVDATVHTVFSGAELLDFLEGCTDTDLPCLIVLDYNMPNMNGSEVLAYLCSKERYYKIPAVVWSTSDSPQYKSICQQHGARRYFSKPEDFGQVRGIVKEMLQYCAS